MKHVIPAALVFAISAGGLATAQTATTNPPANRTTTAPASPAVTTPAPMANTASPSATAPSTTTHGTTTMGTATTTAPALGNSPNRTTNGAVNTTPEPSRTAGAPVAGANSFTESQARARIEEKGFGQVTGLKKDDKGIWRGTAMKDGKSTSVALDYQGNIVTQ